MFYAGILLCISHLLFNTHQMISKENEIYRSIKSIHDFNPEEENDDGVPNEHNIHEFNWLTAFEIDVSRRGDKIYDFDIFGDDLIDLLSIDYNKLRNYIHIRTNIRII